MAIGGAGWQGSLEPMTVGTEATDCGRRYFFFLRWITIPMMMTTSSGMKSQYGMLGLSSAGVIALMSSFIMGYSSFGFLER